MSVENNEKVWTVTELNNCIKGILEGTMAYPFWLEGEVSNLTLHRSGHVYFTVKDQTSQIKATFFNGVNEAKKIGLAEGVKAQFFGRISAYVPRGEYQINVTKIRLTGLGDLYRKFEELKEKLRKEGLFDERRKKKIPLLPLRVGVVSSPEGAAVRDFLRIIDRRFPNLHIRLYPAAVQGKGAELEISEGIRFFNNVWKPDVIIIMRGGGSIEDLWAFNEEVLARTIASSKIPLISAVGHEVDYTIADFVADLRAPTPSAAAEILVEREDAFASAIEEFRRRSAMSLKLALEKARNALSELRGSRIFADPLSLIRDRQQFVDDLSTRLIDSVQDRIRDERARLDLISAKIASLNPYKVLERGYSILKRKADGSIVHDSSVSSGEELVAIVHKGKIDLVVK